MTNFTRSLVLWTAFAFIFYGLNLNSPDFFTPLWWLYYIGVAAVVVCINDAAEARKRDQE